VRRISHALITAASRSASLARLASGLDRHTPHAPWSLPVLTYHRVDRSQSPSDLDPILLSATPEVFAEHVRLIATEYHPLGLDELLHVRAAQSALPKRPVLLTFDDAYQDFAMYAWPILQRHGVPATLFVPTAYADNTSAGEFWWDRLYRAFDRTARTDQINTQLGEFPLNSAALRYAACRNLAERLKGLDHDVAMRIVEHLLQALGPPQPVRSVLSWNDLRRLADEGVTVAPHSRTHPMLDRLPRARVEEEVNGSRSDIQVAIGGCPPVFCYPAGQRSILVEEVVCDAGFSLAFTTEPGHNDVRSAEWLRLRRINVSPRVTPSVLRALLNPVSARLLRLLVRVRANARAPG